MSRKVTYAEQLAAGLVKSNRAESYLAAEPEPQPARQLPAVPEPDLLSSKQVAELTGKMLDTYSQQQRSAVRSVAGEVLPAGGHRDASSSAEIAERRYTSFLYLASLCIAYGLSVGGVVALVWLAAVKGADIQAPVPLWPALWVLGTGGAVVLTVRQLERSDREHTPEGLARQRQQHEHERAMLQAKAEARRFDVGTDLLAEQVRRQRLENRRLEQQLREASKVEPQSHSNMLASYVPEPESVLAEAEAFRGRLLSYVADADNVNEAGRFVGTVPWSARGEFTKSQSEQTKQLFADAEKQLGYWVIRYHERGWWLNTARLKNARAIVAALSEVDMRK